MVVANYLTEKELSAVEKLRSKLSDLKLDDEKNSDDYLVKWLRVQNLNIHKAENMLRKSLLWRETIDWDSLLSMTPSKELIKSFPAKVCGYDREGNYVVIVRLKYAKPDAIWVTEKEDYLKFRILEVEKHKRAMKRRNAALGLPGTRAFLIYDMEGFDMRPLFHRKIFEYLKYAATMVDQNYPDCCVRMYLTYAPRMISIITALFKPFTPQAIVDKTKIFGSNPKEWGHELLQHIPADQLPPRYGGTNIQFEKEFEAELEELNNS